MVQFKYVLLYFCWGSAYFEASVCDGVYLECTFEFLANLDPRVVSGWAIKPGNKQHQFDPHQWTAITEPFDVGVDQYSAIYLTPSLPPLHKTSVILKVKYICLLTYFGAISAQIYCVCCPV
jgi:hypothetical protein